MSTLVVQAHPLDESYNAVVLESAVAGLRESGAEPRVLRLGHGDAVTATALDGVTHLVVVYPTWWGATPAMLFGQLVELLGPWIDGGEPSSSSPVRTVERLSVVTTHGSSKATNLLQGEPGLVLWRRTIRSLCAPGAAFEWIALYKLDRLGEADLVAFLARVRRALASPTPRRRVAARAGLGMR